MKSHVSTNRASEAYLRNQSAERRQFQLYFAIGFLLAFPILALARIWPSENRGKARRERVSVFAETRAEVLTVLGFSCKI